MTTEPAAQSRTPAIAGFLIVGVIVLALGMFVGNRDVDTDTDAVPALTILEPASGDSVDAQLRLRFATPGELRLEPNLGWVAGELHLHAMAGGRELMPAAADIRADGDAFTWDMTLPAGTQQLYLTWAGRHHGNLRGVTDTITVHVRNAP